VVSLPVTIPEEKEDMPSEKEKTTRSAGRITVRFFFFFLVASTLWIPEAYPQTPAATGKKYPVQIGTVGFRIREFEATPSPIKMLEVQIEVINRSQKETVPANETKVTVAAKEIRFFPPAPATEFAPTPEEIVLTHPIPPSAVRVTIVGFPLPKQRLETISFEIQVNPPEGEKKTATYNF
jgi:hypothetical protein